MKTCHTADLEELIDRLETEHTLSLEEYETLIAGRTPELMEYAAKKAEQIRLNIYGNTVYIRGLIEFSNFCKNNCLYCGIRRSNKSCDRYRLTPEQIMECCRIGYDLGFRTFVLQGGEDGHFTDDRMCEIVTQIRTAYPDCAITLSLGERSRESYQRLYNAGADRYLLRHETADQEHYEKLHPQEMSFSHRMNCLKDLKEIGYQVGCGFMVGSPYQTPHTLAKDLKFLEEFRPDMCGIGPFISHKNTPFCNEPSGTLDETLFLLSLIRLMLPYVLLPATTALGTIDPYGREKGILAGANVVMPNLSPVTERKKYELYDNKINTNDEAAAYKNSLSSCMEAIGYEIVSSRGDVASH